MKRVYSASDLIDAQLLLDALFDARIETHLFNANAVGGMGEIPFGNTWPEVWVVDDRDLERARVLVQAHGARRVARGSVRCRACGEDNPSNFDSCWSCGVSLEGSGTPESPVGGASPAR